MCHIPVPAPGCAQDPPHELPWGVPGKSPTLPTLLLPVLPSLCASFCLPLTLSLQGVIHCAMETAKLGPLAFYKVPGWGRLGRAGSRGCGPEQSLGREPSRLCCGSTAAACIRPLSAWPRLGPEVLQALVSMGLRLGPGTTAMALLHPSCFQTAVQMPEGLAHGAEPCVHLVHSVTVPAPQPGQC